MKILGLLSTSSPISMAMAIQAHQPSVLVLFDTKIGSPSSGPSPIELIEAWMGGGELFLDKFFPDLHLPFPFPYTPPNGYLGNPIDIVRVDGSIDDFLLTLEQISAEHHGSECYFDLLPGSKFFKMKILLKCAGSGIQLCYTTEDGQILSIRNNVTIEPGHHLPLLERCWLGGSPIHISNNWDTISPHAIHYQDILSAMWPKKTRPGFDTPIGFESPLTELILAQKGYTVSKEQSVLYFSKEDFEWSFDTMNNGSVNGIPHEYLLMSQLGLYWKPCDLIQGVSFIHKTPEERLSQFRNKIIFHKNNTTNEKIVNEWVSKCELLQLPLDSEVDDFLEAFVEYLVSPESNTAVDHESLYDISLCEVDCLMLTPTGVQSFDSKVMLTELQYKSANLQRSMQQPESLRPTPYYVVCSSNSKKPNSEKNSLHMSQLKIGPALLDKNNSHHWIPNEKLARFVVDLYAKDNDLNINNYNQLQELFCLPLDQIFRVTNLEPSELIEILCPLLKGDEFLQIREMLHQLMSKLQKQNQQHKHGPKKHKSKNKKGKRRKKGKRK
jgi:hypothetical protein